MSGQKPSARPAELERAASDQGRERLVRLNTRTVPIFRWAGFAMLGVGCFFYNLYIGDPAWNAAWPAFAAVGLIYCAVSGWVLRRYYERLIGRFDLAFAFMAADMPLLLWAIYLTGANESWFIALLLVRTAEQVTSGSRSAFFLAHAGTAGYLLLMLYVVLVEGRPVDWPLELTKAAIFYAGSLYIAFTARDSDRRRERTASATALSRRLISDLEMRTGELEMARSEAEAASVAKSQFMTNISHELRTPMNAIGGLLELLSLQSVSPEVRRRHDALRASADEMTEVIDAVLDFSRLESEDVHLEVRPTSLRRVVRDVVRRFGHRAESKGLKLVADVAPDIPEWVEADPSRLRQILMQLVDNGIKFTDEGSVTVRVRRDLSGDFDLVCSVADTGVGFASDNAEELFEAFTQGDASLTRRYGGVGLGLAISRRLVELMRGQIGFGKTPGGGTTVWLRLEAPESEPTHASTVTETVEVNQAHLLVVEDNPLNREVMVAMLESLGLAVTHADNGRAALDSLRDRQFDLVLMDCQMPVMDGYEATRELRRFEGSDRHTPVVAVTAHAMEGDRERCMAAGMDDYLPKPVTLEALAGVVGRWIEMH
ncbi:MAG: response regulator [Acidobacteriota bacterium]